MSSKKSRKLESLLTLEAFLHLNPKSILSSVVWTVEQKELKWKAQGCDISTLFPEKDLKPQEFFKISLAGRHFGNCFNAFEDWDEEGDFFEEDDRWDQHHLLVKSCLGNWTQPLPLGLLYDEETGLILHRDFDTLSYRQLWTSFIDTFYHYGALSELALDEEDEESYGGRAQLLAQHVKEQQVFLRELESSRKLPWHLAVALPGLHETLSERIDELMSRRLYIRPDDCLIYEQEIVRQLDVSRYLINEAVLAC